MWHNTCRGSTFTNITGNLYIDLLIIMLIGLLFIGFSFSGVYSEYKDVKQEEKRLLKILGALLMTLSPQIGAFAFGCLLFIVPIISMISELTC
ncbi:hypothetical protein [Paenibacillus aceris]|uniref:Uncharacterized protein n=1 Tax=Paenibacillus aceris TaxID=869555 RepID=A0ABS4HX85_9BACL|nr:hypothetical protein [Paenibacillus aceris]MBP1962966.1 hypothetical protein [Paenibacillus aceris]NHW38392.1 hypothetical protein [Paenibacillus aceris]